MATYTSSTGSPLSETRIVSPIPCAKQHAQGVGGADRAGQDGARVGQAQVQRVVVAVGDGPVQIDRHGHVRALGRQDQVFEPLLRGRTGCRTPSSSIISLDQVLGVEFGRAELIGGADGAGIDADADGDARRLWPPR